MNLNLRLYAVFCLSSSCWHPMTLGWKVYALAGKVNVIIVTCWKHYCILRKKMGTRVAQWPCMPAGYAITSSSRCASVKTWSSLPVGNHLGLKHRFNAGWLIKIWGYITHWKIVDLYNYMAASPTQCWLMYTIIGLHRPLNVSWSKQIWGYIAHSMPVDLYNYRATSSNEYQLIYTIIRLHRPLNAGLSIQL